MLQVQQNIRGLHILFLLSEINNGSSFFIFHIWWLATQMCLLESRIKNKFRLSLSPSLSPPGPREGSSSGLPQLQHVPWGTLRAGRSVSLSKPRAWWLQRLAVHLRPAPLNLVPAYRHGQWTLSPLRVGWSDLQSDARISSDDVAFTLLRLSL